MKGHDQGHVSYWVANGPIRLDLKGRSRCQGVGGLAGDGRGLAGLLWDVDRSDWRVGTGHVAHMLSALRAGTFGR